MVYKSASMNKRYLIIIYIKWYKFYNNHLLVDLGSQKVVTLKLGNPKHKDWASFQLLTLCLDFLDYFAEMSSYFQMKTNKRTNKKWIRWVKEFFHRFDLANGKYLSIFLRVFARIVKATHFAQVINFRKFQVKNWKQKILRGFSLQN